MGHCLREPPPAPYDSAVAARTRGRPGRGARSLAAGMARSGARRRGGRAAARLGGGCAAALCGPAAGGLAVSAPGAVPVRVTVSRRLVSVSAAVRLIAGARVSATMGRALSVRAALIGAVRSTAVRLVLRLPRRCRAVIPAAGGGARRGQAGGHDGGGPENGPNPAELTVHPAHSLPGVPSKRCDELRLRLRQGLCAVRGDFASPHAASLCGLV